MVTLVYNFVCMTVCNGLNFQFLTPLQLDPVIKEAFDVAYDNIYAFHFAQKSAERSVENMKVS